ncbi:MAG: DUF1989 domain-containing protein [Alphaproteobacteria bacterium]|nr:DUF1989 domain-containing protein [Alphaproteobacteria bacterium]
MPTRRSSWAASSSWNCPTTSPASTQRPNTRTPTGWSSTSPITTGPRATGSNSVTGPIADAFIIPARHGRAFEVKKGQTLRIHQVDGKQVGDCVFYNAHDYREWWHCGQSWAINVICGTGATPSRASSLSRIRFSSSGSLPNGIHPALRVGLATGLG